MFWTLVKAVVAAFNQEKALVGAFSVITNLRMELFEALLVTLVQLQTSGTLSSWLQNTGSSLKSEQVGKQFIAMLIPRVKTQ